MYYYYWYDYQTTIALGDYGGYVLVEAKSRADDRALSSSDFKRYFPWYALFLHQCLLFFIRGTAFCFRLAASIVWLHALVSCPRQLLLPVSHSTQHTTQQNTAHIHMAAGCIASWLAVWRDGGWEQPQSNSRSGERFFTWHKGVADGTLEEWHAKGIKQQHNRKQVKTSAMCTSLSAVRAASESE